MKVTIAMPTLGHIDTRMDVFLYALLKKSKHNISIIHTNRVDIANARNELIQHFLLRDDEYLWFLDDDNVPESIDCLDKLIEANEAVISWIVPSRLPDKEWKHRLCIFQERITDNCHEYLQQFTIPEGPKIFKIANCWMGCVLIKRQVLELMIEEYDRPCETRMATYFWADNEWIRDERIDYHKAQDWMLRFRRYMSEDIMFFERAKEFWVSIYAHKWVRCTHIGENQIISITNNIWSQS